MSAGITDYITGSVDEDSKGKFMYGDWVYYTLDVQNGINTLNLSLDWKNPRNDLDLYLFNSSGLLNGISATLDKPEVISINNPEAGMWTVAINAWELNTAFETFNLTINAAGTPAAIFDTGAPRNPYPSIMGTHTGTSKPNHTVIATKLYTYPCAGTGGHTEYIRIYNESGTIAEAKWAGYKGDWHNITFDKTVILLANKTYCHDNLVMERNTWIASYPPSPS